MHNSCEPALFSLEQLLFSVATDVRTKTETLSIVLPMITEVYEREIDERTKIKVRFRTFTCLYGLNNSKSNIVSFLLQSAGITKSESFPPKGSIGAAAAEENECYTCRANLYISWVKTDDENTYCLQHCLKNLTNERLQAKKCKLIITYSVDDMETIIKNIKDICNGASSQLVWQQQRLAHLPVPAAPTKKSTAKRNRWTQKY